MNCLKVQGHEGQHKYPNEANEIRRPEAAVKEVYLAVFIWRPKNNTVAFVKFQKYEC